MKKVLIISYNFPPKSGVSSRRWAKLVKGLNRNGVECHIITRDGRFEKGVNWSKDISSIDKSRIYEVRNPYPRFFEKPSRFILIRLFKYVIIKFLSKFFFKIDTAQFFYKNLIPKAREIINNGVKNIIVSGPPHSLFYQAALLKIENPGINLILDYRDSWNDETNYQFKTVLKSFRSKMISIQMEQTSISVADSVLFVTNDMKERVSKIFKHSESKFHTLHNFFDLEDYENITISSQEMNDVVYVGTLGSSRRKALELIARVIDELLCSKVEFKTRFHFYTNETSILFRNSPNYTLIKKFFIFHPIVSIDQIGKVISKYAICLSINAPNYSHAFGTKIFDYMALKKQIFLISNEGELLTLLKQKNHLTSDYSLERIKSVLLKIENREIVQFNDDFDQFDLNRQTGKLNKLLI